MVLACGTAPPSGLSLGGWGVGSGFSVSVSLPWWCARRGEAFWQSEEEIWLYSWPRSTHPHYAPLPQDSLYRNTTTLPRPNAETSSHPQKIIRVVEDILASREAPEEKGDGEQENEYKWGRLRVGG